VNWKLHLAAFWYGFTLGPLWKWLFRKRFLFGWRWHFRMTKFGQWLLNVAHREKTPRCLHDAIERFVYGEDGLR
jgi:hypothetical protein